MAKKDMKMAKRLKTRRFFMGKTQAEVATRIGVSTAAYSQYESGMRPRDDIKVKLADYFGMTVQDLFF